MAAVKEIPAVETMAARLNIDVPRAKRLRALMNAHQYANWKGGVSVMGTMRRINNELGTFGVEVIPAGKGPRSPQIVYCNAGDTYDTTILFCRGRFQVGCWGDIVERGNYA